MEKLPDDFSIGQQTVTGILCVRCAAKLIAKLSAK